MSQHAVSFRPARDIRRVRWFVGIQLVTGVLWLAWGAWSVTSGVTDFQSALGGVLGVLGLAIVVLFAFGRRAGVEADGSGLRWRGVLRSTDLPWDDVQRVVIEDRGSPYGSKVGIQVETADGARHDVPTDALSGLEDERHAELRRHLLTSVARFAEGAGAAVIVPGRDDPLVP